MQDQPEQGSDQAAAGFVRRYGPYVLLAAFTLLAVFVRLRVAEVPLERDEGEYAYAGQLILQGIPPYELAYNMKFPGTYYAYALILGVFGETIRGIHLGLLLLNLGTGLLLFKFAQRICGAFPAAVAASGFFILSLDRWIMGVWAHATHFILLPAMAALYLLYDTAASKRRRNVFLAGILLGVAVLMKQHAIFFIPVGVFLITWDNWSPAQGRHQRLLRQNLLLGAGTALPLLLLVAALAYQGVLDRFWYWTFQYAAAYVSQETDLGGWNWFTRNFTVVTRTNLWLWLFAALGMVMLWAGRWPMRTRLFISVLLICSFLAISPGLFFRPHYFILLLPVAALCMAVSDAAICRELKRFLPGSVAQLATSATFIVLAGLYVYGERYYLYSMSHTDLNRSRYGPNPFIESVEIGRYIRENTEEDSRIAVLGSEPQIYFYADRKSVTGYLYTYALMESQPFAHEMQDEMMDEIEAAYPEYAVMVDVLGSWTPTVESERRILKWFVEYWRRCYKLVGVSDIISARETVYKWGDDAVGYEPRSDHRVFILKRSGTEPCRAPRPPIGEA